MHDVGKPVFHAHSNTYFGAWMRDAYPRTGQDMMKRWMTKHFQGDAVEEYLDEGDMRRQRIFVTVQYQKPTALEIGDFMQISMNREGAEHLTITSGCDVQTSALPAH
ncbi:unnamed protein product [Gongylonema pulchrum]|uniref:Olfactomedin-like domain-containing protein n=1 Tax=Gongylonema pulchrum TaxID=637853 RepID=A0A183EV97_9BILA|nr:unnamed protein product [Gongylonema pulchrum]